MTQERTRLIVDLSSILWSCLLAGKDKEFGKEVMFQPDPSKEAKKVLVNSAKFGYENVVNHFQSVFTNLGLAPMDMIIVVEGLHSKGYRQAIYAGYKAGRDRPEESYAQFELLREMVLANYLGLGAIMVKQDGIEADDVIGYLCQKLPGRKIIDSNDGDLNRFISDGTTETSNVAIWKMSKGQLYEGENPYGPFGCRFIPVYKALVGDGNEYPGAKGFGEKKWLNLLCNYDDESLAEIERLFETKTLHTLEEDLADFPDFKIVLANLEMVYKSYACAKVYTNMVNTLRKPLEFKGGMTLPYDQFDDERLKPWAQQVRLVHAANYSKAVAWMKPLLDESPFISFDIETSATDTAEQWLETAKTKTSEAEAIDVFGAELTSFSLTFGRNMQYTLFFTVSHVETPTVKNITKAQAKAVLEMLPQSKIKAIQNVAFELPIIMNELGPLQEAA